MLYINFQSILRLSLLKQMLLIKRLSFIRTKQINLKHLSNMSNQNKHKIAVCQLTCSGDKKENFDICKSLISDAKNQGAEMVFLPEACDFIESLNEATREKSETLEGEFISKFKQLASALNIWISIGSFHRKLADNSDKLFNTHVILDNNGDIKCVNDKIHLFEINTKNDNGDALKLKESDYTVPGKSFNLPIKTPIGSIGTCICYDLRFPQLSSILTKILGAHILTYPSVFTVPTGQAHWEILLRARAIETQSYVIASAQVGKHNEKRSSYGHAMVVDPWGKILANCENESPCFKMAEIDLNYLNEIRHRIPLKNSFRSDLYVQIPFLKKQIDEEYYLFGEKIKINNGAVFLETHFCIAFVNIRPIVPGHIVIIPKKLRLRVEEMEPEEAAELFTVGRHVGSILEKYYNATALNFGIQDGLEAGQSVKHVHLHILPRRKGDFKKDEIYEKLENHDKDQDAKARTEEEMTAEAQILRKLFYDNCLN